MLHGGLVITRLGIIINIGRTTRDGAPVTKMFGTQIALHPHLVAYFHGIVMVTVFICHGVTDHAVTSNILTCARGKCQGQSNSQCQTCQKKIFHSKTFDLLIFIELQKFI